MTWRKRKRFQAHLECELLDDRVVPAFIPFNAGFLPIVPKLPPAIAIDPVAATGSDTTHLFASTTASPFLGVPSFTTFTAVPSFTTFTAVPSITSFFPNPSTTVGTSTITSTLATPVVLHPGTPQQTTRGLVAPVLTTTRTATTITVIPVLTNTVSPLTTITTPITVTTPTSVVTTTVFSPTITVNAATAALRNAAMGTSLANQLFPVTGTSLISIPGVSVSNLLTTVTTPAVTTPAVTRPAVTRPAVTTPAVTTPITEPMAMARLGCCWGRFSPRPLPARRTRRWRP